MYPAPAYVGNLLHGMDYRHGFGTGTEGGNVLHVNGTAQWIAAGANGGWQWYMPLGGPSLNPKEYVIQPAR